MKNIFRVLVIVAAFATGQVMPQSTDGFSVGGVGTFGGTAVNPVTENGWGNLDDYRAAGDCCQYTNSANDAQLWSNAGLADGGSTSRINGASCDVASYDKLRLTCGGKLCARPQCSQFFKQGWDNFHKLYYSGNNAAKCNNNSGRNRFDYYTYPCKYIPVCE